ncbi:RWD-domain-containing protein [Sporormia fimetaria CBS 119925]|uniref:RBR-type E3 ubiquitin transferase n=1 Tax=Sporormia fimetaria CBS 119925 TaxID=1340428 RepID=A0A6A6V238_9PLEO|nr:RWD-domain-containing protein [Sporormia fimetaria CBS 119925]
MDGSDPDDERVDELNTLQAIYPELEIDISHPPTPEAHIELPISPTNPLSVKFDSESTVHQLSHLPPLILDIILTEGYPNERPPKVRLSTNPPWLPGRHLNDLERACTRLWEEYGGLQVLFAYISFLQEAAENAFSVTAQEPGGVLLLPLTLKSSLLSSSSQIAQSDFESGTFSCVVCLEPKKGSSCHRLRHCGHVFCKSCLQDYYNNCIKEGDVSNVKCLSPDCGKSKSDKTRKNRLLSPKELLQIPLSPETVRRYAEIKRKKKLESDPSIVWCPRKWCQGPMRTSKYPKIGDLSQMDESDVEEDAAAPPDQPQEEPVYRGTANTDRLVVCESCNLAFCKICLAVWHGDYYICRKREARELTAEEQASLDYITKNTSPCPTCSAPVEKTQGCNHMKCFQCNSHFCYLCSAWLDADNPYMHYKNPKNKSCYMKLFHGAEGEEGMQFGGRRGAEQEAEYWELQALRIQNEEFTD